MSDPFMDGWSAGAEESAEKWLFTVDDVLNKFYAATQAVPPATHPPLPPRATQHQRQLVGLITNV